MKFVRPRMAVVFVVAVSIMSLAAVGISIRIFITMADRRSQIVKSLDSAQDETTESKSEAAEVKAPDIDIADELTMYFNGRIADGVNAYSTKKGELLFPLDMIFKEQGINFNMINSDDVLEADINGKKLFVRLWEDSFTYNGENFRLPMAAVADRGHVLVPGRLFDCLPETETGICIENNRVFFNSFSDDGIPGSESLRLLRLKSGRALISDIAGSGSLWDTNISETAEEKIISSLNNASIVVKSGSRVYLVKNIYRTDPHYINVSPSAHLSADGMYLYWADSEKKVSYLYDITTGRTRKLGSYCFGIISESEGEQDKDGKEVLYDYAEGKNYKRTTFADVGLDKLYTFIERYGKLVVEGYASYSPDRRKMLYHKEGKGYYTCNMDGSSLKFLDNAESAEWVDSDKILLKSAKGTYMVDKNGKGRTETADDWYMAGQAENGDVFFVKNSTLYCCKKGKEEEIIDLPWKCDYIRALTGEGPYIAVSAEKNGIFLIDGGGIMQVGSCSLLVKGMEGDMKTVYASNIIISPDNKEFAVIQKDGEFAALNLVRDGRSDMEKITLDFRVDNQSPVKPFNMEWISNDRLIIYTVRRGWIIDTENSIRIYSWTEPEGSTIEALIP